MRIWQANFIGQSYIDAAMDDDPESEIERAYLLPAQYLCKTREAAEKWLFEQLKTEIEELLVEGTEVSLQFSQSEGVEFMYEWLYADTTLFAVGKLHEVEVQDV